LFLGKAKLSPLLKTQRWDGKYLLHHQAKILLTHSGFSISSLLLLILLFQRIYSKNIILVNLPMEKGLALLGVLIGIIPYHEAWLRMLGYLYLLYWNKSRGRIFHHVLFKH
jgi:hypothetical protein